VLKILAVKNVLKILALNNFSVKKFGSILIDSTFLDYLTHAQFLLKVIISPSVEISVVIFTFLSIKSSISFCRCAAVTALYDEQLISNPDIGFL